MLKQRSRCGGEQLILRTLSARGAPLGIGPILPALRHWTSLAVRRKDTETIACKPRRPDSPSRARRLRDQVHRGWIPLCEVCAAVPGVELRAVENRDRGLETPGQQPGIAEVGVILLHPLPGAYTTLTTADCCPFAASWKPRGVSAALDPTDIAPRPCGALGRRRTANLRQPVGSSLVDSRTPGWPW